MCEHGALRCARSSRRINNGGEIIGRNGARRRVESRIAFFRTVMHQALHLHRVSGLRRIHHHDPFQHRLVLNVANFQQLLFTRDKNYARSRILQDVSGLFPRQSRVNGHDHGAEQQAGKIRDSPFRPIFAENSNPIALADAPLLQSSRHAHNALVKLRRRNRNPLDGPPVHDHHAVIPFHHGKENFVESLQAHGQPEQKRGRTKPAPRRKAARRPKSRNKP